MEHPLLPFPLVKKYLDLFKRTWTEFGEDKAPRLGAALAYYTIFSLAPLLLIAVAIAGLVFGAEAASNEVSGQLRGVFGESTAQSIEEMIQNAAKPASGTFATILGIVTLLLGASGVFGQLKEAMNTIWDVEEEKSEGIMGFIKDRFLSMAMVMGVGFLLLVTLVLDAVIAAMGGYLTGRFPGGEALLQVISQLVSLGMVTVLFATMFRYLPDVHPRVEWRDVWFGAGFTALLFVIGKFLLGLYLGKGAVGSSYGAAGSLVVLLVWVYWSAQILFFGAEFTQVYARSHGSRKGQARSRAKTAGALASAGVLIPAEAGAPSVPARKSGGFLKIVAGGLAGLIVGLISGLVAGLVVMLKSLKRLLVWK